MAEARKRPPPSASPPWQRPTEDHKRNHLQDGPKRYGGDSRADGRVNARNEQEDFAREQTRLNQIQEAEKMREWVSKEDEFVLQQSKKKAHIRVKEGRAKAIDWLAVTLGVIDPTKDLLEDENEEFYEDIVDPTAIFEGLSLSELQGLGQDIDIYMALETNQSNWRYWHVLYPLAKKERVLTLITTLGFESNLQRSSGQASTSHSHTRTCI